MTRAKSTTRRANKKTTEITQVKNMCIIIDAN